MIEDNAMKNRILSIIILAFILVSSITCFLSMNLVTSAAAVTYERDTTWYDASKTILEIKDIPDFLEFMYQLEEQGTSDNGAALGYTGNLAAISWTDKMPFEGQTVLLASDIVLNSGITFTQNGPSSTEAYCFVRNNNQIGFGGIFDGQGHTISGLYISTTKGTGGSIFGVAGAATKYPTTNVTVKNLQIKNSYITSTSRGVATVFASAAFNANVRIENVYSTAYLNSNTVTTNANDSAIVGGLVANVGGKLTIDNCVYAGTMTVGTTGTEVGRKHFGGLVGITSNRTINDVYYYGSVNVQSSAFYGTLSNDKVQYVGKVIGQKTASDSNCTDPTLTVENSILAGTVNTKSGTSLGTVAGDVTSNTKVLISNTVYTPIKNNSTDITAALNSSSSTVTTTGAPIKITDSSIIGDKSSSGLGNGLDTYWVYNSDVNGYPLPLGIVSTFTEESLLHNYVTPLGPTADELLTELGDKKSSETYTTASYSQYSAAYDAIVTSINKLGADLSSINVSELRAEAEAKLVTIDAQRAYFLELLGAKKSSTGYTAESYAEYSAAYDAILESINTAGADIDEIDVSTLKIEAEAKLRIVPKPENGNVNSSGGSSSIDVNIYYDGDLAPKTVYSVDVIWDDLSFTYNAGYVQWNPEEHKYGALDGDEGWTDAGGQITVVNHSNDAVAVEIAFTQASTPNGTAVLNVETPEFILDSADGFAVADAPKNSTKITVSGVPTSNAVVGKLTVTVNKKS